VSVDFIEGKQKTLKGGKKSKERFGGFKRQVYTSAFKYNNIPLRRHHKKHKCAYAPAWKTIEFLTFGQTFTTFTSLLELNLKKEISSSYGIQSVSKFENYLRNLVDLRNACAHSDVLFDYRSNDGIASLPFLQIEKIRKHSLGACIDVLVYFIQVLSVNRKEEFLLDIHNVFGVLKKQFPQNIDTIEDTILHKMMIKL
jgi:abortive infection bacteriophage resistance protein